MTSRNSIFVIGLLVLWGLAVRQLGMEWSVNPLYQYGWWVIPLAAYLFYERIADGPPPAPRPSFKKLSLTICFVFLATYIPFRIIQEANFDWILLNWYVAISCIAITLCVIAQLGGKPWLVHFGFPILFIFSSVPWPVFFENLILQNLMGINALITAKVISLGSMEAIARGNIIEIGGQFIGVEEACSGIRSLQTSLMMSLFLGEFYRIRIRNRVSLLLLGFFVSFLFNSTRTIVLTYIGATEGLDALESWHDPLGYGVLFISLAGLWSTAYWYSMKEESETEVVQDTMTWIAQLKPSAAFTKITVCFLIIVLIGEATTEYYYKVRERELIQSQDFSLKFPSSAPFYQEDEFSEITKTILKFNEGNAASWEGPSGNQWRIYLLEWEPKRVSRKLVSAHTPEVCYPAAGYNLESFLGINTVVSNGIPFDFRTYLFKERETYFYVFHGVWEEKTSPTSNLLEIEPLSRKERINTVIDGKRNLGQKILGVSVLGPTTLEEAILELNKTLSTIIIPNDA